MVCFSIKCSFVLTVFLRVAIIVSRYMPEK